MYNSLYTQFIICTYAHIYNSLHTYLLYIHIYITYDTHICHYTLIYIIHYTHKIYLIHHTHTHKGEASY